MKHIFIMGSKGIPARYGGFETFVDQLTARKKSSDIKYYVSCLADNNEEQVYNGVHLINIKVPNIGSAKALLYDLLSLRRIFDYIQKNQLRDCVVYILACRIGPFIGYYKEKLSKLEIKVYVNPDGHEWKRSKWSKPIRLYWKFSERLMVKNADLLICDSKGIEKYILNDYSEYNPKTEFIAYGSDCIPSKLSDTDSQLNNWFNKHKISANEFYLIVGRFVPENNYELMITEFMKSKSNKDLVIISNVEKNKFYDQLLRVTNFKKDPRVKFVGTVYDQSLLKKIREQAYGYFHGHEVGGTNPSLLEALSSTRINILLDVVFNKEVAEDAALYFTKQSGSLSDIIKKADNLTENEINHFAAKARQRIDGFYSWDIIVRKYEHLFLSLNK
ncbi:DUF1972 domain-containing protein [Sporolactobacillus sp. STSJ-5]|uniref:beta 1-4 rhamnosyltransferase Cps2T n=1 Tax=Sporolactobacillus sp. STSJ-5 TaxID=2965076 RepID=UPI0021063454|nr:DUF1972 domain-containing protein [Sporolactobacillus sp. STSJ-5]MCQ2009546.1 DUF1972 domain-containing protein [Sporolactobacillus sp. STSJ-5]